LGWGNLDTAIDEYKKAIKLKSDFKMYHLDLAKAYIEDGDEDLAAAELKKLLTLPKQDEDDDTFDTEAKKLIKELE
jgi:FimV-like protein